MEEGSARLNVTGFFKVMGDKNWNRNLRLPSGMEPDLQSHDIVKIRVLYARVYKVRVLITSDGACRFESGWAKFARDAKLRRSEFFIFNQIMRNEYRVVQLARREGDIYFQEGWSTFVQDNGLAEGDLVTVRVYVGLNKWSVSIYDPYGWRKIPTKVANTAAVPTPDSRPPVADSGSSRLDSVGLRFIRKFARYALKTNLDLPNTFALAMDRRDGGPVTLENAVGSKYYASLHERDNEKGRRFYLAAEGWIEFRRETYVRLGNILLFTLVRTSEPTIHVELLESVLDRELLGQARRGGLI
ncbi:hypothetical protein C2S53_013106 [Perilla frutescens var. hirtella]|uniref:TF-B3 domain-containing protein n=1 Tax=Perilla frutescens var. hirtella TaxID=608512 RepID=A0AAD4IZ66_PERFH|nr:hypothetical protein C2S53_013106 [Perilla frutescens var. hirtella]